MKTVNQLHSRGVLDKQAGLEIEREAEEAEGPMTLERFAELSFGRAVSLRASEWEIAVELVERLDAIHDTLRLVLKELQRGD